MAVTIKVTKNFNLARIARDMVTKDDMRALGLLARERIIKRTLRGESADGGTFHPYSAAYAKRKRAALGTSAVNLQVSGNMLNQLGIVDLTDHSVTLGWL